jgi:hypothetical protein
MRTLPLLLALAACTGADTDAPVVDDTTDTTPTDTVPDDTVDTPDDTDVDTDPPPDTDLPVVDTGPFYADDGFCRRDVRCGVDEVCNLAMGVCERRLSWSTNQMELLAWSPTEAAAGDYLVIDGARFWANALFQNRTSLTIGGVDTDWVYAPADTNRLVVQVEEGMAGALEVTNDAGQVVTSATDLLIGAEGVIPCDAETPAGTGVDGVADGAGAFGAGYVDLPTLQARVYYPAQCGGLRRPAMSGTRPLVGLMHANAAFLNYDHLGMHLATWGFVTVAPFTDTSGASDVAPSEISRLSAVFANTRNLVLSSLHPALLGLSTTEQVAFVGHARGVARIGHLVENDEDLADALVGLVYLAPLDDGQVLGGPLLQIQGSADGQALPLIVNLSYALQRRPKWKVIVQGGNHGQFTDHKVWTGLLDNRANVSRQVQQARIRSYVLPFLQRVHGLAEPFAATLDGPVSLPNTIVSHDP